MGFRVWGFGVLGFRVSGFGGWGGRRISRSLPQRLEPRRSAAAAGLSKPGPEMAAWRPKMPLTSYPELTDSRLRFRGSQELLRGARATEGLAFLAGI